MSTRAVPVILERSPGGAHGWTIEVDGQGQFKCCTATHALGLAMRSLGLLGAGHEERRRVSRLLASELDRKRRAEVTAEVPVEERSAA